MPDRTVDLRSAAHGRRSLLATGGAAAVAAIVGAPRPAWTDQPPDEAFLPLSSIATGKTGLDAEAGRRLYQALVATHEGFPAQVAACAAFARTHHLTTAEPLAAALDAEDKALAAALRSVIAAWYTGVVGDGPQAKVIAYREALMFSVVDQVVPAPSYCRAGPDYWTAKPSTT